MTFETLLPKFYSNQIRDTQRLMVEGQYYFYVADGKNKSATANNALKCTACELKVASEIIYGGRIDPSNIFGMINRFDWTSGVVYAKYKTSDLYLSEKIFFVLASNRCVYKCIDNNIDSPSTIEPSSLSPGAFTTSDGYVWQLMYSLTESELNDLKVGNFIPIIESQAVIDAAIPGTISSFDVETGGRYDKLTSGLINQVMDSRLIRIEPDSDPLIDAYKDMAFNIESGSSSGKIERIRSYHANTSGRWVTLWDDLDGLNAGDQYSITPYIEIIGDGTGATAKAEMRGDVIEKIKVLNPGRDYTWAEVNILANPLMSSAATSRVNISPLLGHGTDIYYELYSNYIQYYVNMDAYTAPGIDANSITFAKAGIVKNISYKDGSDFDEPTFNNTFELQMSYNSGAFTVGDDIWVISNPGIRGTIIDIRDDGVVIGTYHSPYRVFNIDNTLTNENNLNGVVVDVKQPEVSMSEVEVIAQVNTDTIKRDENSRETMQIMVKIK